MDFTHGMKVMRAVRKMSQTKLASASGLSMWAIGHAEAGRVNLNDSEKSRIRIALTWAPELDPLLEKIASFHFEQ